MLHAERIALLLLALFLATGVWAHDEGPPEFPCIDGPFGVPGLELPPEQIGEWGPVVDWPLQGSHLILLHTGKVLTFRVEEYVWDPETGALESRELDESLLFCSGHATLRDGRVLISGGGETRSSDAIADSNLFDPVTETWTRTADLQHLRFYPTSTILPDGRILVTGGTYAEVPDGPGVGIDFQEIYDATSDSFGIGVAGPPQPPLARLPTITNYPPTFLLDDGRLLALGKRNANWILDVENGTWEETAPSFYHPWETSSAAMYRPNQILRVGGLRGLAAVQTTATLDMDAEVPAWRELDPMHWPRRRLDLVLLPTGDVLAVGGSVEGQSSPECAVHATELWSPETETWTVLASMSKPRIYHSAALLLPDGRVAAAGGENSHNLSGEKSVEIYSPPYLFKGPRPEVGAVPSLIDYQSSFVVETPDPDSIASVALMRPGSVTHNLDQSQSYRTLGFEVGASGIEITAPEEPNQAPPGFYMLFLVNTAGVPSKGRFVRLDDFATLPCQDGIDNDGDGYVDLDDPGCADSEDLDETSLLLPCDDGFDNDLDQRVDFDPATLADPEAGTGDPGCFHPVWAREDPECQDGIDNDGQGGADFDAGELVHGVGSGHPEGADPQCVDAPWRATEGVQSWPWSCGLGHELVLAVPILAWLRRRRLSSREI